MKTTQAINTLPMRVQFRHMPKSEAIKQLTLDQIDRFERFTVPGSCCDVVIDKTNPWHKGGVYKVSVRLTIPGERLYVTHVLEESSSREFLCTTVREAFDEIERQIRKQRKRLLRYPQLEPEIESAA